jgi:hypothetical protein
LVLAVASFSTSAPRRATWYDPYHHLLGVRANGWFTCYEECMVVGTLAQELVEFVGFETSDDELACVEEFAAMAGKTWYFGSSFITQASIAEMQDEGYFRAGRVMPPPAGETVQSS